MIRATPGVRRPFAGAIPEVQGSGGGGGSRTRVPESLCYDATSGDTAACDNSRQDAGERLGAMLGVPVGEGEQNAALKPPSFVTASDPALRQLLLDWPNLPPPAQAAIIGIVNAYRSGAAQ